MDPATAIGMAAAIIQLLDLGITVAKRLDEYSQAAPGDVPKSLKNINTTLPLITNSLNQIKSEATIAAYDPGTRTILHGVVLGCLRLVQELNEISEKIVLKESETTTSRLKKGLWSLRYEDKIADIDRGLQAYIQVLILHHVVSKKDVPIQVPNESEYFEVKELLVKDAVERPELIAQLHSGFSDAVRSLNERPIHIILQGRKGAGKSQLALRYCHEAHRLKHFRWVFWLEASSPASLLSSLEHVADTIRRTRMGTTDEKTSFVKDHLAQSWQPWLLILDNYRHKSFDTEPITGLIPTTGHGAVLMTTQQENISDLGTVIKVHRFLTPDDDLRVRREVARALLTKDMSGIVDAMADGFRVNSYSAKDRNAQPLINVAAEEGFDEAVRLFLDMGANPKLDPNQLSAIGCAVFHSHLSTVKLCLDHEDQSDSVLEDGDWDSVIRYAISKGNLDILKMLLDRRLGKINLDRYWQAEGYSEAVQKGNMEALRLLTSYGKMPQSEVAKAIALTNAVKNRQMELVNFFLQELHADPSRPGDGNRTALYYAVDRSSYEDSVDDGGDSKERMNMIKLLIDAGADVNIGSPHLKNTPLHLAALKQFVPAMQLLLKHGADPTLKNDSGENPLHYAGSAANKREQPLVVLADVNITDTNVRDPYFSEGLALAIRLGWRELALQILEKANINTTVEDRGDTPLLLAIKLNQVPMARMLIRKGAAQHITDGEGKVPLLSAAEKGMQALVKELAKAKDSPGLEVSDRQGRTPLMLAALNGHESVVRLLLDLGADRDAADKFGDTALDVAEEANHEKVIKLLEA